MEKIIPQVTLLVIARNLLRCFGMTQSLTLQCINGQEKDTTQNLAYRRCQYISIQNLSTLTFATTWNIEAGQPMAMTELRLGLQLCKCIHYQRPIVRSKASQSESCLFMCMNENGIRLIWIDHDANARSRSMREQRLQLHKKFGKVFVVTTVNYTFMDYGLHIIINYSASWDL